MKLKPVLKDTIWGGEKLKNLFGLDNGDKVIAESWEVSVHPDGSSLTSDGTFADYIGKNPEAVDALGSDFPVLIKYIDAKRNLSVQVHPQDGYAREHENDNGKTEMWYIVQADEGAGIFCGFKNDTDKSEFLRKIKDGTVEDLLNFIPVKSGDCFLIEAGTVHAIGAGCVICEVQQNSNVTYRVYDYNRVDANGNKRQLHLDKAMEVINFSAFKDNTGTENWKNVSGGKLRKLTECKYFKCRELALDGEYEELNGSSFTAICVLDGVGEINGEKFTAGNSFFISCGEKFKISGNAKIILTTK